MCIVISFLSLCHSYIHSCYEMYVFSYSHYSPLYKPTLFPRLHRQTYLHAVDPSPSKDLLVVRPQRLPAVYIINVANATGIVILGFHQGFIQQRHNWFS